MEKREHRRFAIEIPVRFSEHGQKREGMTRNLSRGGAFVSCVHTPPLGAHILLEVCAPRGSVTVPGVVRHIWKTPEQLRGVEPGGFGIAFSSQHPLIDDLCDEAARAAETRTAAKDP